MLNAVRAARASWQAWQESRTARRSRRAALAAAIEPLGRAVARLGDPVVLARLAAALPSEEMRTEIGGSRSEHPDDDFSRAMARLRWQGLLAAERAGAAHQFDATPAIWAWEVDDPTWQAALDAIDVAMAVHALQLDGLPVTTGMAEAHRQILEIVTEQAATRA